MKDNESTLMCNLHNSPIGGICSDNSCISERYLLCIKCVVDPNSCVRLHNHKLTSIKEFFDTFSKHKQIKNYKELVSSYIKLNNYNFKECEENILSSAEYDKIFQENLKELLSEKLNSLFRDNIQRLKQREEEKILDFQNAKKILQESQSEFKDYTDVEISNGSHINQFFTKFLNSLQLKMNSAGCSNKEWFIRDEICSYILKLKVLLNKSNDIKILKRLEEISHYLASFNRPIINIRTEMENKTKIASRNILEEINHYFKNKDNIQTTPLEPQSSQPNLFNKDNAPLIMKKSSNTSTKSNESFRFKFFNKNVKKQPSIKSPIIKPQIKTLNSQGSIQSNSSNKEKEFILNNFFANKTSKKSSKVHFNKCQDILSKDNPAKIPFCSDKHVIMIEKYKLLCYSNLTHFILYDLSLKKEAWSMKLIEGVEYYQKLSIAHNLNDYIYSINCFGELLEINLTDMDFTFKTYQLSKQDILKNDIKFVKGLISSFILCFEYESFFENENNNSNKFSLFLIGKEFPLQVWEGNSKSDEIKFKCKIKEENIELLHGNSSSVFINNTFKMQIFDTNVKIGSSSFQMNSNGLNSIDKTPFLIISSNIGIEVFDGRKFQLIHKIVGKGRCNSFFIENLMSIGEAYLYSVWEDGNFLIHSMKSLKLIKEMSAFNLQKKPLLSICYLNDKNVLIGMDGQICIVNHTNPKLATTKFKELEGKIIGLKAFELNQEEVFIAVSSLGTVKMWSKH
jgi:hypothetical protein